MIVDALGNPVAATLTPGQQSDLSQAGPLLEELEPSAFLADKAYDLTLLQFEPVPTLARRGFSLAALRRNLGGPGRANAQSRCLIFGWPLLRAMQDTN